MGAYVTPAAKIRSLGDPAAGEWKVEMTQQDVSTYTEPDWTSPTTMLCNPFEEIPDVSECMEAECGTLAMSDATFRCSNDLIATNLRMSDVLTTVNPLLYTWHVRIWYKPRGGSWTIIWWGVVDHPGTEIDMVDPADKTRWKCTFHAIGALSQFDDVQVTSTWMDIWLKHATYDYIPGHVYIGWSLSGTPYRTELHHFYHDDGGSVQRHASSDLRFFKLKDVVQGIANSMGLTTTINNGVTVDQCWDFKIFDGSVDQTKTWEDLYIISGIWDSLTSQYAHHNGFFDYEGMSAKSFYNVGSLLEWLKAILVPFGMVASVKFTAAGVRYLHIEEIQDNTGIAFSGYLRGSKLIPADRTMWGLKVTCPDMPSYLCGSDGDGALSIECRFTSCNRLPQGDRWQVEAGTTGDLPCFYHAIFAKHGSDMYSVYKTTVKSDGQTDALWGTDVTADANDGTAGILPSWCAGFYWFTPGNGTYNNGIYRRVVRRWEFEVGGIDLTTELRQYVNRDALRWWIKEKTWNLTANKTKFVCEAGEF